MEKRGHFVLEFANMHFVSAACMTFQIISPSSKLLSMHVELFMDLHFML